MQKLGKIPKELVVKFWLTANVKKVVRRPALGECWEWQGAKQSVKRAYGVLGSYTTLRRLLGTVLAHRIVYMLHHNVQLESLENVCHHCDNTICVRPTHLFQASNAENVEDKVRKGRHVLKITDRAVKVIRKEYALGTCSQDALAVRFGISQAAVSHIVRRTGRWRSAR